MCLFKSARYFWHDCCYEFRRVLHALCINHTLQATHMSQSHMSVKQNNRIFHMLVIKNKAFVDRTHLHLYLQLHQLITFTCLAV